MCLLVLFKKTERGLPCVRPQGICFRLIDLYVKMFVFKQSTVLIGQPVKFIKVWCHMIEPAELLVYTDVLHLLSDTAINYSSPSDC